MRTCELAPTRRPAELYPQRDGAYFARARDTRREELGVSKSGDSGGFFETFKIQRLCFIAGSTQIEK